jgi:hypothetical protein
LFSSWKLARRIEPDGPEKQPHNLLPGNVKSGRQDLNHALILRQAKASIAVMPIAIYAALQMRCKQVASSGLNWH